MDWCFSRLGAEYYLTPGDAIKNYVNAPDNSMMESERMGNYAYKLMSPLFQKELRGYSPQIFENLMKYRKVAFA